jgi:hypothetical protein
MSLSDLASLGSVVSGIAVLASLIFLFFQMRQMTEQVRQSERNQQAAIQMGRSTGLIDTIYKRTDPRLQNIMLRGRNGDTSMSPEEVETFHLLTYSAFLRFEDTYLQHQAGTIHPEAWKVSSARLKRVLLAPGWRACWKTWRSSFGSDFAEAVDQLVSQARTSSWEEPGANWASDVAEELRLSAK